MSKNNSFCGLAFICMKNESTLNKTTQKSLRLFTKFSGERLIPLIPQYISGGMLDEHSKEYEDMWKMLIDKADCFMYESSISFNQKSTVFIKQMEYAKLKNIKIYPFKEGDNDE